MFQALSRKIFEPPAFGLDISDITVKFCRITSRGSIQAVEYYGEVEIPEGIVVGGEIKRADALELTLRDQLKLAAGRPVRERYCVASLPEEKSFVRVIELPRIQPEDVAHAVRWEVEGVIPLPLGQIFYDFAVLPPPPASADHQDVLITAFPKAIVESYHAVLRRAGLIPLALELESQAISRAVATEGVAEHPVIIIDMGATRTSFIIVAGGSLIFTKSVTVGGRDLETAIAKSLGVDIAAARRIKIEAGLNKNFRGGAVFSALQPILSTFVSELQEQFAFYRSHPRQKHAEYGDIAAIYLCGGDANLIGLEKYLATAIKKPVKLVEPFAKLALPPGTIPPIARPHALKYTTAIGLALRAAGL